MRIQARERWDTLDSREQAGLVLLGFVAFIIFLGWIGLWFLSQTAGLIVTIIFATIAIIVLAIAGFALLFDW